MPLADLPIDGNTRIAGLIAHPARHSLSPLMHNLSFISRGINARYCAFDVEADQLEAAIESIRALKMLGANVSMPYKEAVILFLDQLDQTSSLVGSVNTIVNRQGILTGYTTDGLGLVNSLKARGYSLQGKKITLAGAGGAGSPIAIQAALSGAGQISIFNRAYTSQGQTNSTAHKAKDLVEKITSISQTRAKFFPLEDKAAFRRELLSSDLYIDATSVGMGNQEGQSLVDHPSWLSNLTALVDTVYSPAQTRLLTQAQEARVPVRMNGLGMLIHQGAASFKLWTGQDMPVDQVEKALFS